MKKAEKTIDCADLAIIIPAYKSKFLRLTLESIAAQEDRRFVVFVGDDASPDNLEEICKEFKTRFQLVYKRFEQNYGSQSLTNHWNRCVRLSVQPWVWLFSDDDIMDSRCVSGFHKTLEQEKTSQSLYRFNTMTINGSGKLIKKNPPHPSQESSLEFALARFSRKRKSFAAEYIFSREIFDRYGGFVDFPLAWCADDATWIQFGTDKGIASISQGHVSWRKSGINISSRKKDLKMKKLHAANTYLGWFDKYLEEYPTAIAPEILNPISQMQRKWFLRQIKSQAPYTLSEVASIARLDNKYLTPFQLLRMFFYFSHK